MAQMNGFARHGLDRDAFEDKSSLAGLKSFDAFRESWREEWLPGQGLNADN
jgi:hypothetical protein